MRTSFILIFPVIWMSAVLAVCGCDGNDGRESSGPRIEPALLGSLTIDADGGTDTVSYSIINPVEGGKVSASASENWISGLDCSTENAVIITSDPNPETVRRSCVITLTYSYSEGGKAETQINVIQKEAVSYDFDMSLEIFTATWYGPLFGLDGEHRYYTWVSDMPFVNSTTQVGGTYYLFDIFSTPPADESDPLPPAGTYTLGEEGATAAMTFTPEYSMGVSTTTDEQVIFDTGFEEGSLEISYADGVMTLEAFLTDTDGRTHHVTYTGKAEYQIDNGGGNEPPLEEDLHIDGTYAAATYMSDNNGVMEIYLQIDGQETDADGNILFPLPILYINAWMPLDEDGHLAARTYRVTDSYGEDGTLRPGEYVQYTGIGVLLMGTRADLITESGTYVGLIADGEMTVSGEAGAYSVECSFLTAEGRSVTCSWSGDVTVAGVPGPYSTLTGDYTLDLEGAEGTAYYNGNYYGTGDNWIVQLLPGPGPDGVQIELVTSGDGVEDGIPDGTYTASMSAVPSAGEFMTGSMTDGIVFGTNYVGDFTEQGLADSFAPATAGRLDVTGHGDGTCTFEFSFLDDKGNTWDGKWTGTLSVRSSSGIKQMKLF